MRQVLIYPGENGHLWQNVPVYPATFLKALPALNYILKFSRRYQGESLLKSNLRM